MKRKGFTLIELLVVIAIIGLLSTMAVVSLNGAREKARDAQRISDVKQLSTVLEMASVNTASYDLFAVDPAVSCDLAGELTTICGTIEGVDFSTLSDPSNPARACDEAGAAEGGCEYTMMTASNADGYEICFWLENGAGNIPAGFSSIIQGSVLVPGSCTGEDT
jgi:prepilin-type N-terminal cleavage/methylation domain-containing protein